MKLTLNRSMALAALLLASYAAIRSQVTAMRSQRYEMFQNDSVHVWRSVVYPNQPLALHRHDHPRVLVALTDGQLDLIDSNGVKDTHILEKDHAYWLPAMPPGAMHNDVNPGDKPLDVMMVELEKEK